MLANTSLAVNKWPKIYKILPLWRNFAKSGLTVGRPPFDRKTFSFPEIRRQVGSVAPIKVFVEVLLSKPLNEKDMPCLVGNKNRIALVIISVTSGQSYKAHYNRKL